MTVAFVHGNPETAAIWRPLLAELAGEPAVTLSPPGFGAPVPAGFGATADEYLSWLTGELEAMTEPPHLVGHDWGGLHVLRVACTRPDLIRSWCTDVAGGLAPGFVWHDLARTWQTPGAGEQAVAATLAAGPAGRAARYQQLGMTADAAAELAAAFDEAMGRCVLALYRSAAQPALARWGELLPGAAARPGLGLIATGDPFTGDNALARWAAGQARAQVEVLPDAGHWWMLQAPRQAAVSLARFWSATPDR
jgi:pimeloyl-ACP methyl ester carboxylesterase